jgi:hypothetical protein
MLSGVSACGGGCCDGFGGGWYDDQPGTFTPQR